MDIEFLTSFFMWCSIINGSLMLFITLVMGLIPELAYKTQKAWLDVSQETYNTIMYGFLAIFKILFIFLNLAPYIALRIIG